MLSATGTKTTRTRTKTKSSSRELGDVALQLMEQLLAHVGQHAPRGDGGSGTAAQLRGKILYGCKYVSAVLQAVHLEDTRVQPLLESFMSLEAALG